MTQDLAFGRAGLATSAGGDGLTLHLKAEDGWGQEGDRATLNGILKGTDFSALADLKAARDQLQGYGPDNSDEPVIPVTWANDSSRDGFYRVQNVEVLPELTGRLAAAAGAGKLAIPWTAELLRVPTSAAPIFEVVCLGANRSTAHAITEWSWVGAIGSSASADYFSSRIASPVSVSLSGDVAEAGVAAMWAAPTGSKTAFYDDSYLYAVSSSGGSSPYKFYNGSARAQLTLDSGTTYRTIVGRQLPVNDLVTTQKLRLTNGLIRCDISSTITYSAYDSGGSNTFEQLSFTLTEGGATQSGLSLIYAPVILRNDPVAVTARVFFGGSLATDATGYCDLTVRRGSWVVEGRAVVLTANEQLGIFRSTTDAGTGVTGGIDDDVATDGNKYQLRSPSAITADTTDGGIYLTSAAQTFPFAIATDRWAGDNTTSPSTSGLYFAAMNHIQRIAAR